MTQTKKNRTQTKHTQNTIQYANKTQTKHKDNTYKYTNKS